MCLSTVLGCSMLGCFSSECSELEDFPYILFICLFVCLVLISQSSYVVTWPCTYYVAQTDFQARSLLPQPSQYWDVSMSHTYCVLENF